MRLLLSNNKHVGTKIGWKHGTNSNQLYRPEASLTGGKASPEARPHRLTVVIKALQGLKKESESTGKPVKLPKVILLSSGTVDERFPRHVPRLLLPILLRSASYVYQDLINTEKLLDQEKSWLTSVYMKPGALSVDEPRGYALSLDDQTCPTAYLDLAAAMVEVTDDTSGQYGGKSVSMVCTNVPAKFPSGTPLCIVTGLLRHYFQWLHPYLPLDTGPR
jgi:hypothetical protein